MECLVLWTALRLLVDEDGLELWVSSLLLKGWYYKYWLEIRIRALHNLGRHPTNWATPLLCLRRRCDVFYARCVSDAHVCILG